ncbi:MAG: GtrA family protein [Burkholderiales bacterium]|nr:GtrA family protein [Burkholderiales bacterium]
MLAVRSLPAEIVRFVVVGVLSNILNFVVYVLVHWAGGALAVASAAGYVVGMGTSYHFGKSWVFAGGSAKSHGAVFPFVLVYAVGGAGMTGIIEAMDRMLGIDYRLSWLAGAAYAAANNYLGSKWLVFREGGARGG